MMSSLDLTPERLGPYTQETLPPDERGPNLINEESIQALCSNMFFVPEMETADRLKSAERALRMLNKTYNHRTVILKGAIVEFHAATGYKPTQAKDDVWLPCGRRVKHMEFITDLHKIIKEYQPCTPSPK